MQSPAATTERATIAIIGGSGLADMKGLQNRRPLALHSSFGKVSGEAVLGELAGVPLVFLPRHGSHHTISPSKINYRANIDALKRLGVRQIIAVNAVGSLREELPPGTLVLPNQFIDRTARPGRSFFTDGCVAHVSMADPICSAITDALVAASPPEEKVVRGGTYIVIEGPQFSTRAESDFYRSLGCQVIGMTALPEARLAREAEICYAMIAMVTDYDCWHPSSDDVDVEEIMSIMEKNRDVVERVLVDSIPAIATLVDPCPQGCSRALDRAVVTVRKGRSPKAVARLEAVAGRFFQSE